MNQTIIRQVLGRLTLAVLQENYEEAKRITEQLMIKFPGGEPTAYLKSEVEND